MQCSAVQCSSRSSKQCSQSVCNCLGVAGQTMDGSTCRVIQSDAWDRRRSEVGERCLCDNDDDNNDSQQTRKEDGLWMYSAR